MDGIVLWDLDPYSGDLVPMKLTGEARATVSRHVTAVSFSDDREFVYGATTSGDYIVGSVRVNKIVQVVQATKMTLNAILYHGTGVVIGCGDSSIKMYTHNGDYKGQLKLDGSVITIAPSPDRLEVGVIQLRSIVCTVCYYCAPSLLCVALLTLCPLMPHVTILCFLDPGDHQHRHCSSREPHHYAIHPHLRVTHRQCVESGL